MTVNVESLDKITKPSQCLGIRHLQVLMIFLGLTLSLCSRVSMSIAIVAMTDSNNEGFFDWSIQRQSVILSAFPWGYVVIMAFGGVLTSRFGGMRLLLLSLICNSVMALLIPVAAYYGDWILVCICRFIQGVVQGILYPSQHYLIAKWVPPEERSRMSSFIYSGSQFGTAGQLLISGYIAAYWGWPAIFYVNGAAGLTWAVVYLIVGSDSPQVSKLISAEERLYIQTTLGQIGGHKKYKTPWKAILTSLPYLSVVAANVGIAWAYWIMLTYIPTYMSKVLQVDIKSNGVVSALPYMTMFVMNFPVGYLSDFVLKKQWLSVTVCRKICNSVGFFGPAIVLLTLTYVPTGNVTLAVFLFCLMNALSAGMYSGYLVVIIDMASNFASTLIGMSNCAGCLLALFAPLSVGWILEDETDPKEWRIIFNLCASFYIVTNVIFILFATSEEQKWNKVTDMATSDRSDNKESIKE